MMKKPDVIYYRFKRCKYRVLITSEDEGGFSVSVPKLSGCFTQGETIEEAIAMAKDAICLYVESLEDNGEPK